jgi:hypothetical protein
VTEESLFREVDEEVRQEQLKRLWQRYGNYFLALCLAVVALVAGIKGWQYWQARQAEAAARVYTEGLAAAEAGRLEDATRALGTIDHAGYRALARLREAAALGEAGKTEDALRVYEGLIADASLAAPLRDVARIRAAYLLVPTLGPKELAGRLTGLDGPQSPWRHQVREIQSLAAYRAGDHLEADRFASEIAADLEAPPGIRQRAQTLSELLTPLLDKKATQ